VNLPLERPGFRLAIALAILTALTAIGTAGYMLVEGAYWLDALYMTVITLSTVGFGEIIPLSSAGRIFTIGLILSGVGTAAYLVTSVAQLLAVDVLTKLVLGNPMQKQIDRVSNHVIVCGYGRLGLIVVEELTRNHVPVVIIESNAAREPELKQSTHPYLIGNATLDEVLLNAGLARARAVVAGTNSDPDNVFITLGAREHRRDIHIHARGETSESIRRLKQAGANYVLSAFQMGGLSLAASILRPSVAQFLEIARPRVGHEVDLEEIRVLAGARLIGSKLVDIERERPKLRIVALMRGERIDLIPEQTLQVQAGDYLVVIGERTALERLASVAAPEDGR
jgi:voltage-gated potassium channel